MEDKILISSGWCRVRPHHKLIDQSESISHDFDPFWPAETLFNAVPKFFDSKFTFKKHFEDILGRCNARYHRIRLLGSKKWGPSPSTILQIYKQCVRPIFEYGSLSTITTSDTIISEIQRLQNKFIRLALRLPTYISIKLLHDSSGLPYVKDRLFSRATKTLERISANPLVEESISSTHGQPCVGSFSYTGLDNPSGKSLDYYGIQG